MCLAAMVIAGGDAVYYAFDNTDAAPSALQAEASLPPALRLPLARLHLAAYTPRYRHNEPSSFLVGSFMYALGAAIQLFVLYEKRIS